jgi:ABC-type glycerol-3-phosphate transport system permease component
VIRKAFFVVFLAGAMSFVMGPPAWEVVTSLKPTAELDSLPPVLPHPPTLEHYRLVFEGRPFGQYILNSAVVAVLTTLLSLLLGAPCSYALTRFKVRGGTAVLFGFLAISMVPAIALVGPLYLSVRALGLRDTWWGLVAADTVFVLPLVVWILATFFRALPADLERAARVDGATALETFLYVALPLAVPGVVASAILALIFAWNEFLFALAFTSSPRAQTVPVGIALFPGLNEMPWGEIAAGSLVASAPIFLMVFAFQRRLLQGITAGAVKG